MSPTLQAVANSQRSSAANPPSAVSEKHLATLAQRPASALAASTLHLANLLQSALELDKLMEVFAEEVNRLLPLSGMEYVNMEEQVRLILGREGPHSNTYDLVVLDRSLGVITFRGDEPLEEDQLQQLEALICALVYPLRNALMYKRALDTALKDPVTGINNRAALNATIDREVNLSHRHGYALSVIMLDLDHFKRINDEHGHLAGDTVLRTVAGRITDCTRGSDMVFRYGGEEFTVVLSNTDIDGAALLADRIRKAIAATPIIIDGFEIAVTVSMGVSTLEAEDSAATLLSRADAALYDAKTAGRNRVMIQTGAHPSAL
ncbi:MAG: GGDEF domain-containing protein [Gammaproteobacteria bacterium]